MASDIALRVVEPITVDSTVLTATNVPETDHAAWSAATTYSAVDRVIKGHKIWQATSSANLNHDPEADTAGQWWVQVSATNRYKMFDTSNSTATTNGGSIVVTLTPGQVVTAVGLLGMVAETVQVVMTDPVAGVVYDSEVIGLGGTIPESSYYSYFFAFLRPKTSVVLTGLPAYPNATIQITILGTGTVSCATCIAGFETPIGLGVHVGARVGRQDYSRVEANQFGDLVLVRRASARRASFEMMLRNEDIDAVDSLLDDLRAVPCLWIGVEGFECTYVYGIRENFEISIAYTTHSLCTLDLKGLT